jgi:YD repeat-containing protein
MKPFIKVHSGAVRRLLSGLLILLPIALQAQAENVTHTYDDLNRLIRSDYDEGTVVEYSYDAAGNRLSRQVDVFVNNPPVANAGADQVVASCSKVSLNGADSYDPDHLPSPLTYLWTQASGSSVALAGSTSTTATFTPWIPGIYGFDLVVNDGAVNSVVDSVNVTVNDVLCLALRQPNDGEV